MGETGTRSRSYRIHKFDPNTYDWADWEILLDTYINVEGIIEDNQKRNILIASLGVIPFKTLISLCKPKKPTDYSYTEIITKLRTNYTRVTFASTERIKFFQTKQEASQSLPEFANTLRGKTTTCNFPPEFYEQAPRGKHCTLVLLYFNVLHRTLKYFMYFKVLYYTYE
ncbi:unnamed protein product [Rotaria sordida]|uniref:Uncharacterized protein n=1 Tax=Rotaria sordida TaxID=392033 RepID=A0A815Y847_9BILA|nr:unnamed protein product [Rotaria sordida]